MTYSGVRDDDVRSSCFASLDVLLAKYGEDVPYAGGLDQGFPFRGLSLCSIHHRAFDQDLVGISPDYHVEVSAALREGEDGPMLNLLKGFHETAIVVPDRRSWRPDRDRLAARFERFLASSGLGRLDGARNRRVYGYVGPPVSLPV